MIDPAKTIYDGNREANRIVRDLDRKEQAEARHVAFIKGLLVGWLAVGLVSAVVWWLLGVNR